MAVQRDYGGLLDVGCQNLVRVTLTCMQGAGTLWRVMTHTEEGLQGEWDGVAWESETKQNEVSTLSKGHPAWEIRNHLVFEDCLSIQVTVHEVTVLS